MTPVPFSSLLVAGLATVVLHSGFLGSAPLSGQEVRSLTKLRKLQTYAGGALAFSPNGKLLLTCGENKEPPAGAVLWDVASARAVQSFSTWKNIALRGAFMPDGGAVCIQSYERPLHFFDVVSGRQKSALDVYPDTNQLRFQSLAISVDGRLLALGHPGGDISIWDLKTSRQTIRKNIHRTRVVHLAFSADGKSIVSTDAERNQQLKLSSATTLEPSDLHDAMDAIRDAQFSGNGQFLAGCGDTLIRVWSMTKKGEFFDIEAPRNCGLRRLSWSPDGKSLAAVCRFELLVFDVTSRKLVAVHEVPDLERSTTKLSHDGIEHVTWHPADNVIAYAFTTYVGLIDFEYDAN